MSALANARHERFAQELAKGVAASQAYTAAGYKPNDGNAIRMKGNERIAARVAEIQERGAIRAELTVASLTEDLRRIRQMAEKNSDAASLSVARQATMDMGKLNGLVIDRAKVENVPADVSDRPLSEGEWASQLPHGHA